MSCMCACPGLPKRRHHGDLSDLELRFVLSLVEVTRYYFFYGAPAAPGKESISFSARRQCLLWVLVRLLCLSSSDGRML